MSDWARTRSPGERFSIPAEAYNRWTEAALRGNINSPNGGTQISDGAGKNDTGRVQVKNGTGGALSRYDVVSINDGVVLSPTAAENEFLSRPIFAAGTPDRYTVRWGVIQQPLADEQIGMAVVTGLTPVRLNVTTNTLYRYATVTASSDYLVPSNEQGARLLYRESGTGEVWALVDVGHLAMHAAPFLGYVDEDGDLQIAGGKVYTPDVSAGTAVAAYGAAVQNSRYYYVKASVAWSTNVITVTGTIQDAAAFPGYTVRSADPTLIHILIGTTDANGVWTQVYGGGDIHLPWNDNTGDGTWTEVKQGAGAARVAINHIGPGSATTTVPIGVTGISLNFDAKGHFTGLTTDNPDNCQACAEDYDVVISGLTGTCADANGTHTVSRFGSADDCAWYVAISGTSFWVSLTVTGTGLWAVTVEDGSNSVSMTRANDNGCPAIGAYGNATVSGCTGTPAITVQAS